MLFFSGLAPGDARICAPCPFLLRPRRPLAVSTEGRSPFPIPVRPVQQIHIWQSLRLRPGRALSFGVGLRREEKDMANSIVLFESADHEVQLSVEVAENTVWLTQAQLVKLFDKDQSVISRHINNAAKREKSTRKAICTLCILAGQIAQ